MFQTQSFKYWVAPHWGAWIEMVIASPSRVAIPVAPHWGAWIEIRRTMSFMRCARVAPHWGAWIEIYMEGKNKMDDESHPTGVRGLKSRVRRNEWCRHVAPHWGAWIEILAIAHSSLPYRVAPHWGAWIEIKAPPHKRLTRGSRTPLGCVD